VLIISILTLNFPKIRVFQLQSLHFSTKKILTRRRFSDSPKFREGVPPTTTPLIALKYEAAPCPSWSPAPLNAENIYRCTSQQFTVAASRHRLRSANRHRLIVPRCRLNTYGRPLAFPVACPTIWNSLQPDELRDPTCDVDSFKEFFKTILFSLY